MSFDNFSVIVGVLSSIITLVGLFKLAKWLLPSCQFQRLEAVWKDIDSLHSSLMASAPDRQAPAFVGPENQLHRLRVEVETYRLRVLRINSADLLVKEICTGLSLQLYRMTSHAQSLRASLSSQAIARQNLDHSGGHRIDSIGQDVPEGANSARAEFILDATGAATSYETPGITLRSRRAFATDRNGSDSDIQLNIEPPSRPMSEDETDYNSHEDFSPNPPKVTILGPGYVSFRQTIDSPQVPSREQDGYTAPASPVSPILMADNISFENPLSPLSLPKRIQSFSDYAADDDYIADDERSTAYSAWANAGSDSDDVDESDDGSDFDALSLVHPPPVADDVAETGSDDSLGTTDDAGPSKRPLTPIVEADPDVPANFSTHIASSSRTVTDTSSTDDTVPGEPVSDSDSLVGEMCLNTKEGHSVAQIHELKSCPSHGRLRVKVSRTTRSKRSFGNERKIGPDRRRGGAANDDTDALSGAVDKSGGLLLDLDSSVFASLYAGAVRNDIGMDCGVDVKIEHYLTFLEGLTFQLNKCPSSSSSASLRRAEYARVAGSTW